MTIQDRRIKYTGYLDRIQIDGQVLTIEGWVASEGAGRTACLHVAVSGMPCRLIEQVLDLPSLDVRAVFPALDAADRCRFLLRLALPEGLPSPMFKLPLVVEPLFAHRSGNEVRYIAPPDLPDSPGGLIRFISGPSSTSAAGAFDALATPSWDPTDDMIPDHSVASYVGDAREFKSVGRAMLERFRKFCDLKPHENTLEVGCGIGRIAIPMTQYLTTGRYVGFDIVPHGIEWCQQKITPRYPNFTFFRADIYNKHYQPEGKQEAAGFAFPFQDGTFDFVFLTSVFTHMMPTAVTHYIAEISRVLRPGGRCFCTAYVIDDAARRHLGAGTSIRAFTSCPEGYWSDTPEDPEAAVAFDYTFLSNAFTQAGLQMSRVISGEWWKDQFAQDILIVRKTN